VDSKYVQYVSSQSVHVSTSTRFRLVWDYVPSNPSPMTAMDGSHTQYQPDLDAARGEEGEGEEDMLYTDLFNGEGNKESRAR